MRVTTCRAVGESIIHLKFDCKQIKRIIGKCLSSNERINAKMMKRQLVYSKYFLWIDCETFEMTRIYIFNNIFI